MDKLLKRIGQRYKEIREGYGLSQEELEGLIKYKQETISHIEHGRRITIEKIDDLCRLVKLPLRDFFNFDGEIDDPNIHKLLMYSKRLNENQLNKLIEFVKSMVEEK